MMARRLLMLPLGVAVTALATGALFTQTSHAQIWTATPFLAALPPPALFTPTFTFCRALQGRRCAPILTYGGAARHDLPAIEPVIKADLPHVRVSFILEEISHVAVANGGITSGGSWSG